MKFFSAAIGYLLLLPSFAKAIRGRPVVDQSAGFNRLVTDKGDLIRGVSMSLDGGDPYQSPLLLPRIVPEQASFDALATVYGFNAVHVYIEGNAAQNPEPPGINIEKARTLRDRCAAADLYLIFTIGCNGENGQMNNVTHAVKIWEIYAPEFANDTHVIYEPHNE